MNARSMAQPQKRATPTFTRVHSGLLQRKCACGTHTTGGGECGACSKQSQTLQRATRNPELETRNEHRVPPVVHEVSRSPGQPLDSAARTFMEPRFGHDFGQVRVHADTRAAESAKAVNARAYTLSRDIVFGAGQYSPRTAAGRRLIAHELAHVVQQVPGMRPLPGPPVVARAEDKKPVSGDVLASLSPDKVAAWYGRLANLSEKQGGELSALFLRSWLKNRDPNTKVTMPAHPHILNSTLVLTTLPYHRRVYLTEEKARFTDGGERWAGILPRLQGKPGFQKWDGTGTLTLHYEGLAEGENPYVAAAKYKLGKLSEADADVFTSLHGFQLRTDVDVTAAPTASKKLTVTFQKFEARARDRYDWNPDKHLTMPNPDFGSKSQEAVEPDLKEIVVYHSNAKRLEDAGLAAPYDLESKPWTVTNAAVAGPATMDPNTALD